jgi:hypothetical protein
MRFLQRLPSDRLAYWLIFVAGFVMLAALLWSAEHLPMLDVPQYPAQVTLWQNHDDPAFNYRENQWIDLARPRLLAVGLLRLAAQVLRMRDAVTLVGVLGRCWASRSPSARPTRWAFSTSWCPSR